MHLSQQPDHSALISRPSLELESFPNNLAALLNTLQSELTDLSRRRSDINRRIRLLERTVRGLRAGVGQGVGLPLASSNAQQGADRTFPRGPGEISSAEPTAGQPQLQRDDSLPPAVPQLQRACRIALAEAAGPASPEDLYSRIARRNSFPFTNLEVAVAAIVQTLNSMADAGEVRRLGSSAGLWARTREQEHSAVQD